MTELPNNPDPSSLIFKQEIHESNASSIFEVEYKDKRYALKVFHDEGDQEDGISDDEISDDGHDYNRFRNEVNAYKALHTSGACDSGLVLKYYGSIDRLDPTAHQPRLDYFHDEFQPQAILLEYLENAESPNCVNYSQERLSKAMDSLDAVHGALILHNDIYPKNVLIVPGDPERVLIVDFDIARTFPTKELFDAQVGRKWQGYMKLGDYEDKLLLDAGKLLAEDQKEGLPPNTKFY